jgi:membrane protein YdbS with pleckstrin-like domain
MSHVAAASAIVLVCTLGTIWVLWEFGIRTYSPLGFGAALLLLVIVQVGAIRSVTRWWKRE